MILMPKEKDPVDMAVSCDKHVYEDGFSQEFNVHLVLGASEAKQK